MIRDVCMIGKCFSYFSLFLICCLFAFYCSACSASSFRSLANILIRKCFNFPPSSANSSGSILNAGNESASSPKIDYRNLINNLVLLQTLLWSPLPSLLHYSFCAMLQESFPLRFSFSSFLLQATFSTAIIFSCSLPWTFAAEHMRWFHFNWEKIKEPVRICPPLRLGSWHFIDF